ncbi:hypothetical protein [Brachyspira sp.]|uniref:hypothetical protein n=1 Tax=Brachyspira sp. TaxID=1977261 RepID=UPI003D7D426F
MENIVNKLKSYFSSNFGKLTLFITSVSFLATLFLSVILKNRIDISIFKGLISAVITMIILYALNIFLTKYLGDIIEDSDVEIISNVSDDSLNNSSNSSQEESDNLQNLNNADNDILPETKSENGIDAIVGDISSPKETIKNDFNIDKNNKVDYDNLRGDIGDIILGASSYKSSSDISDSSEYYGGDKKINERVMEREVMEDPEKAASAIRTVIAKDKGK